MTGGNIFGKLEGSPLVNLLGVQVGTEIGSSAGISGRDLRMWI